MGLLDWHGFEEVVEAGRRHAAALLAGLARAMGLVDYLLGRRKESRRSLTCVARCRK